VVRDGTRLRSGHRPDPAIRRRRHMRSSTPGRTNTYRSRDFRSVTPSGRQPSPSSLSTEIGPAFADGWRCRWWSHSW